MVDYVVKNFLHTKHLVIRGESIIEVVGVVLLLIVWVVDVNKEIGKGICAVYNLP